MNGPIESVAQMERRQRYRKFIHCLIKIAQRDEGKTQQTLWEVVYWSVEMIVKAEVQERGRKVVD